MSVIEDIYSLNYKDIFCMIYICVCLKSFFLSFVGCKQHISMIKFQQMVLKQENLREKVGMSIRSF